jgi:hypothetical protein
MDTILLVITLISAATAIVAFASARRLRRTDRERSEARVAALAQAADGPTDGGWMPVGGEMQWSPAGETGIRNLGLGTSTATGITRSSREARPAPIPNPQAPIPDVEPQISSGLFGTVQREETSGSRLPLFAAAALIVMLGGALIFLNTSASNEHAATVAHVNHAEPLELVALGHARDVSVLTIKGTVRNPSSGVKVEGLTAVISLLDRGGALVSTKDVPLDYRALGPGEEAPFTVSIPDPGSIARYRVSFRAGTDVVPHVDRRSNTKLASARD